MRIFELLNTLSTSDAMSGIECMHKAICANWCQRGEFKCFFQSCMRSVTTSLVAIWNHWNWLLPPLTISIQALFFLRQIGTVSTKGPDGILEIFPAWGVKLISSEWHSLRQIWIQWSRSRATQWGCLNLQCVNSILSKSRFQQPRMCFCLLSSLQYRVIWYLYFTLNIWCFCLARRSIVQWCTRRSARCLDSEICKS
jgi:hypothetical protein